MMIFLLGSGLDPGLAFLRWRLGLASVKGVGMGFWQMTCSYETEKH